MKHLKKLFIASSISVTIFTIMSIILYSIFGRGSFQFITPFTIPLSNPLYNAFVSIITYIAIGVSISIGADIINDGKFGINIITSSHFITSWITISILGVMTSYPLGIPNDIVIDYYLENTTYTHFIIYPIIITFILYIIIYLNFIVYHKFQIKNLNKKVTKKIP
ncbi:DUF3021 family protein [Lactococcus garvieae]|uniref:DUF3021 family protein n=1 Tax=Lactococcus garvieae TaxID=1363 RepID=UPI003BB0A33F